MKQKILFICGSRNQTTQMHKISNELDGDFDCWFSPYYATGLEEFLRKINLTEMSIMGSKMVGRCLQYLTACHLKVDYRGERNNYDLVFEMDADFSHDPKYLPRFLDKIEDGYDLVVGSRYIDGVSVVNWPISRLILSYTANIYTRVITGLKVKDTTAGFMCYKVSALSQIDLNKVRSNGYSFQIEMKFKFYKKGFKITEIPILFIDRTAGSSKMSRKVVFEAYLMVWKLKWKSIFRQL